MRRALLLLALLLVPAACKAPGGAPSLDPLRQPAAPAPLAAPLFDRYDNRRVESYAPLVEPSAVATLAEGGFVLADHGAGRIHLFDPEGFHVATAGERRRNLAPRDLAAEGFHFLVLDGGGRKVLRYDDTAVLRDVLVDIEALTLSTVDPVAMAVDVDGRIALADAAGHRVLVTGSFGGLETEVGSYGGLSGQFREPRGVAFGADGILYVSDRGNRRVQAFDRNGFVLGHSEASLELVAPAGIATDRYGNLYICDPGQQRVVVCSPSFEPLLVVGDSFVGDDALEWPVDCSVGPDGLLHVVDQRRKAVVIYALEYP